MKPPAVHFETRDIHAIVPDPLYLLDLKRFWIDGGGLWGIRDAVLPEIPEPHRAQFSGIYDLAHQAATGSALVDMAAAPALPPIDARRTTAKNSARIMVSLAMIGQGLVERGTSGSIVDSITHATEAERHFVHGADVGSEASHAMLTPPEAAFLDGTRQRLGLGALQRLAFGDHFETFRKSLAPKYEHHVSDNRPDVEQLAHATAQQGAAIIRMNALALLDPKMSAGEAGRFDAIAGHLGAIGGLEHDRSDPLTDAQRGLRTYQLALIEQMGPEPEALAAGRELCADLQLTHYKAMGELLDGPRERAIARTVTWFVVDGAYPLQRRRVGVTGRRAAPTLEGIAEAMAASAPARR